MNMKKATLLTLAIFLALSLLLPAVAMAEKPVTAAEMEGVWEGTGVRVEELEAWGFESTYFRFYITNYDTALVEVMDQSTPLVYQDGEFSGEGLSPRGFHTSFKGTVNRDGEYFIIDGEWTVTHPDRSGRGVYKVSLREKCNPVAGVPAGEDDIPALTGPEQEGEQAPAIDWDWDSECDCDDPWEEHAGAVATALISIIAALGALLGGAGGSAAAAAAGAATETMDLASVDAGAPDGDDFAYGEETSPEEKEVEGPDDYFTPPEAGFGGPADNPYTSFQSGKGPGDCVRYGLPRYFINTSTLNLIVQDTIFAGVGLGPRVELTLSYNSASPAGGIFGRGWSFSYERLVEQQGEKVYIQKGTGQMIAFTAGASGSARQPTEALPPAGIFHRLLDYGEYWLYTEKSASLFYRFDKAPDTNPARLTAVYDYYGNRIQLFYSPRGNLDSLTDAAGRSISFTFNERNLCTAFALADGRQAHFSYDEQGRLVHTEDLMGIPVDYKYDAEQALTEMVTGKSKRAVAFTYRKAGKQKLLQSFADPNGNSTHYNLLSDSPRRVEATDPEGNKTIYQSRAGLTEKITCPLGHTATVEYRGGLPVKLRDRNGGEMRWAYDSAGRQVKEIDPLGQETSFSYDHYGNPVEITDPLGGKWRYRYNDRLSLVGITSPAGRSISLDYNEQGLPAVLTGFDGLRTILDYDRFGNVLRAAAPAGGATSYTYDEFGYLPTTVTDTLGHSTAFEHDGNGRLIKRRHPDGAVKSLLYDCCYSLLSTDERGLSRGFERDAGGNITREIDAAAAAAELAYDGNNSLVSLRDRCGRSTGYRYDAARRLIEVNNALGQTRAFGYDAAGNLAFFQSAGDRLTTFQYDRCRRSIASTDPLGNTLSLERDALGRVTSRKSARGNTVGLAYDPDGLLEKIFHDGKEAGRFHYDSGGRLTRVADESGEIAFEYDEGGRIRRFAYPGNLELTCSFNKAGFIESLTYPGGLTVRYSYDCRMRPVEMSWPGGGVNYTYDAAGNLVREMRSNGTESSYEYDENERLAALKHLCGKETFIERRYTRDASGAILEEKGFQPLEPPLDRDFTFSCNPADQVIGTEPASFRYDADGNLGEAPGWKAAYDAENRLVELTCEGAARRFHYNSLDHLVQMESAGRSRRYGHDLLGNLLFESEAGAKADRLYLYCHSRPVAVVDAEGGTLFYHYDQGGNTLALTGGDGSVAAAYAYSPFGRRLSSGEAAGNPFTFCGAFGARAAGDDLYHMRRRFYSATWGRFVQRDPLGLEGGTNAYAYGANNPLFYIDPDGTLVLEAWLTWKAVGAVVGVVTFTVAAAKTAHSAYSSVQEYKKKTQAADKAKDAFRKYADICNSRGATQAEKEDAYKRYEEAFNEIIGHHNEMLNSSEKTITNAIDTGISYVTPDCLNPLTVNVTVGDDKPPNPCTGGGGNYFVRKVPRLPSHYVFRE